MREMEGDFEWRRSRHEVMLHKLLALFSNLLIHNETVRMKVTPPLAVAPLAQEGDMRWNPNDDGIDFNP